MVQELRTAEINGEKVTNLHRDLGRRGYSKEDFYQEFFDEVEEYTGNNRYGSPNLSKKGILEIAKKLEIITDYKSSGIGNQYTIKWPGELRYRTAMNKNDLEREIADRCGFEKTGQTFGKADLFDILYEIQKVTQ